MLFFFGKQVFKAKELVDNTSPYMKTAMSGVIIDHDRLVIGTEDGLFCLDMDRTGEILGLHQCWANFLFGQESLGNFRGGGNFRGIYLKWLDRQNIIFTGNIIIISKDTKKKKRQKSGQTFFGKNH